MIGDIEFKKMNMAGDPEVYVVIITTSMAEYTEPIGVWTLARQRRYWYSPDSTMMGTKRETWASLPFEKDETALWIFKILIAIKDVQMTFMARVIE